MYITKAMAWQQLKEQWGNAGEGFAGIDGRESMQSYANEGNISLAEMKLVILQKGFI